MVGDEPVRLRRRLGEQAQRRKLDGEAESGRRRGGGRGAREGGGSSSRLPQLLAREQAIPAERVQLCHPRHLRRERLRGSRRRRPRLGARHPVEALRALLVGGGAAGELGEPLRRVAQVILEGHPRQRPPRSRGVGAVALAGERRQPCARLRPLSGVGEEAGREEHALLGFGRRREPVRHRVRELDRLRVPAPTRPVARQQHARRRRDLGRPARPRLLQKRSGLAAPAVRRQRPREQERRLRSLGPGEQLRCDPGLRRRRRRLSRGEQARGSQEQRVARSFRQGNRQGSLERPRTLCGGMIRVQEPEGAQPLGGGAGLPRIRLRLARERLRRCPGEAGPHLSRLARERRRVRGLALRLRERMSGEERVGEQG